MRLGNGAQDSVNAVSGSLEQPFYKDAAGSWRKLTFASHGLDLTVKLGGVAQSLGTPAISTGVAGVTSVVQSMGGGTLTREYTLESRTLGTKHTVCAGSQPMTQFEVWVGTRDDYVGSTDVPHETLGSFSGSGFVAATSKAGNTVVKITSNTEGIFFYTTHASAHALLASCCSFSNVVNMAPSATALQHTGDTAYGLYFELGDVAAGECKSFVTFYAAGNLASLQTIVQVSAARVAAASTPAPTAAPTTSPTHIPG